MSTDVDAAPFFVIKAAELPALHCLDRACPQPLKVEWINRGTNRVLRPTSVDMLLRTLFHEQGSPSVVQLHQAAGLKAFFRTEVERREFAAAFNAARVRAASRKGNLVVAVYDSRENALAVISRLTDEGIPEDAISVIWRSASLSGDYAWSKGHSALSVAGATAGGGLLGAMFGIAIFSVPGIGPVAMAGALAAYAFHSIAAVGGIFGATGGALAKMLTDHDVDGVAARYYEKQIQDGKVFMSVDTDATHASKGEVVALLRSLGGHIATRH